VFLVCIFLAGIVGIVIDDDGHNRVLLISNACPGAGEYHIDCDSAEIS
jgi:hypothetical protein